MKVADNNSDWCLVVECEGIFKETNPGCHTKLIINEDDIHRYYAFDGFTGDLEGKYYSFTCPMCGHETIVPSELIPDHVKERANTKQLCKIYYANCM